MFVAFVLLKHKMAVFSHQNKLERADSLVK